MVKIKLVLIFLSILILLTCIIFQIPATSKWDSSSKPLYVEFLAEFNQQITNNITNHSTSCLFPGFGEKNAHVIHLNQKDLNVALNKSVCVNFTVAPREYHVNNKVCRYGGVIKLRAYTVSKLNTSFGEHWSLLSPELEQCVGKSELIPLNGTVKITACMEGLERGDYYVYLIVLSQEGWKSWDYVRVHIS